MEQFLYRPGQEIRIDPDDLIAIGVVLLAVGAVIVAIIVPLGFVFGSVQSSDAVKMIVGCVGGGTVSGLTAALSQPTTP
jgi:hypothetical protein